MPDTKKRKARKLQETIDAELSGLSGPYIPASEGCTVLNTIVPDSMDYETHIVLRKIKHIVGGSLSDFVEKRLDYKAGELCRALSAEQVDAVAMAIYNIEYKKMGVIIGDQTGIGKGRIAASMIRYGCKQGLQPVFLSEKPNLFSDIYRDLAAIGSENLVPFIVNAKDTKTDIKDENGNIIYQSPPANEQNRIFMDRKVPGKYDFVCATYSQFNSIDKKPLKPEFLRAIADDNILVMDESHNASGTSNTGDFLQKVIKNTRGVTFLSATFSKRPDNMPVYAMKTSMSEANMTTEEMVEAIKNGGVALQEILSAQLVSEGQMIRREYSFEGVEVNYIHLDEKEQEHKAISDNITEIMREIIAFQDIHVDAIIKQLDKIAAAEGKQTEITEGTSKAGVDNSPYFSKVFQVINQMLFSIKAGSVTERTISRLKEGKKPLIAFASTMGSFLESMENDRGMPLQIGDVISSDFKEVLYRGLDGVMKYTTIDVDGQRKHEQFSISELPPEAQADYLKIKNQINKIATGICISPIDLIMKKIQEAGYSVAEVTGRKYELQLNDNYSSGIFLNRKKLNTNDAFRMFNNNEVDVLMINQSGSTGASAHAIVTAKVPAEKVRQRVMIILQAELNINTEVQKRGRINRTGQIMKPIYDYVISSIPAEKRLMMMLQKKLKSLDANTTSNQSQSNKILQVDDFLNKYGDKVVLDYLIEKPELNLLLGDPLDFDKNKDEKKEIPENTSHKVSGRVAVLSTQMQESFYNDIMEMYGDYVEYLKQTGEYDLEVESMLLDAETMGSKVIIAGKGGTSVFATDTSLEKCEVNILKKPFTKVEIENLLNESLKGRSSVEIQNELRKNHKDFTDNKLREDEGVLIGKYDKLINKIPLEKAYLKLSSDAEKSDYFKRREMELSDARRDQLNLINSISENHFSHIDSILKFFKIGIGLNFPVISFDQGAVFSKAVFLGYVIDLKKANPYSPSAIKGRFAVSDSTKYISLALSGEQGGRLQQIMGASFGLSRDESENMLDAWEKYTREGSKSRGIRYIITGNLLQGAGKYKGKLISYSTKDGGVSKGMLMPEKWVEEDKSGREMVNIPIIKALPVLQAMSDGNMFSTVNSISFIKTWWGYKITMPRSKPYKPIFTDKDITSLLQNSRDGFEMVSNQMLGKMDNENIVKLVQILQEKYSVSILVERTVAELYLTPSANKKKDTLTQRAELDFEQDKKNFNHPQFQKPKSEDKDLMLRVRIARAKAKALKLKLKLYRYKNPVQMVSGLGGIKK